MFPNLWLLNHAIRSGELLDCDLITHKKVFNIICEIHEFEPEIIYPVLPLLTPNLSVTSSETRRETTILFGSLLSSQRSKLADEMPDLWKQFKSRFSDVDRDIRIACVKKAEDLLVFHPEYAGQVTELVMARCRDFDESVRLETVRMVRSLAKRKFSVVSEKLLACVAERTRDRKADVRQETVKSLSSLFRTIYLDERLAESERASVLVVFDAVVSLYCQPLQQDRILIEKMFTQYLIPYKAPVSTRMQVLIDTYVCVGAYGAKAYDEIFAKQSRIRRLCRSLLELIEADDAEENKAKIDSRIQALAECSPEPAKAAHSFKLFAQFVSNDSRSAQLLNYVLGDSYNCEKIEGCLTELLSRMRGRDEISKEDLSNVQNVLERGAPLQIDAEAICDLVQKVYGMMQKAFLFGDSGTLKNVPRLNSLLRAMAEHYPRCFRGETVMKLFAKLLDFEDMPTVENTLKVIKLTSPRLASDSDPEEARAHARLVEICNSIGREGNPHAAKYAVRCIVALLDEVEGRMHIDQIVEDSVEHLDLDDRLCATAFRALGSAVEAYPEAYKTRFGSLIMEKVVKIALSQDIDEDLSVEGDSVEEDDLDAEAKKALYDRERSKHNVGDKCVAKLMGLKFMCVYLVSQAAHIDKSIEELASRTLKMLTTVVKSAGDVFERPIGEMEKAQLRAMAGCCVLKLASCRDYAKLVTVDEFIALSSLVHDDVVFVRWRFISRLLKHLDSLRLSIEYMGLLSLVALVNDKEFRAKIRLIIEKNIAFRRKFLSKAETQAYAPYHQPEYCIAYAVYILSKYSGFGAYTDEAALSTLRGCLWYLLELFQSTKDPKNLEFIRIMFQDIKSCGDATMQENAEDAEEQNKKMWALCDLGILLLSYRIKLNFGGATEKRPVLSKRFFIHQPTKRSVQIYVPESLIEEEKRGMKQSRMHGESTMATTMKSHDKSTARSSKGTAKKTKAAKRSGELDGIEISERALSDVEGGSFDIAEDTHHSSKPSSAARSTKRRSGDVATPALALFVGTSEHRESTAKKAVRKGTTTREAVSEQAKRPLGRSNGLVSTIEDEKAQLFKKPATFMSSTPIAVEPTKDRKRAQTRSKMGALLEEEEEEEPEPSSQAKRRRIDAKASKLDQSAGDATLRARRGAKHFSPELPSPKKASARKEPELKSNPRKTAESTSTRPVGRPRSPVKPISSQKDTATSSPRKGKPSSPRKKAIASPKQTTSRTKATVRAGRAQKEIDQSADVFASLESGTTGSTLKTQETEKSSSSRRRRKESGNEPESSMVVRRSSKNTREEISKETSVGTKAATDKKRRKDADVSEDSFGLEKESEPEQFAEVTGTRRAGRGRQKPVTRPSMTVSSPEVKSDASGVSGRGRKKSASASPSKAASRTGIRSKKAKSGGNDEKLNKKSWSRSPKAARAPSTSQKGSRSPVKARSAVGKPGKTQERKGPTKAAAKRQIGASKNRQRRA
ncbi:unnamed protein product [Toxocara canis]|uniref:Condensin complex subunit 3 n=2 Tax=Toxocara canis TaxID=6265 RepID=A0A183UVR4_TOXCA|nr:unnamed protein product [Toxocara canis]